MPCRLPHARPRALRDFMFFLQNAFNQGQLSRPPSQLKVRRNGVHFRFAALTPAVTGFLYAHGEIDVFVNWQGRSWDLLYSDGAWIQACVGGLKNRWCLPEHQQIYPSKRQLLRAETFEPFLQWCRDELMSSRYLYLYRYHGGTEARLDPQNGVDYHHRIDLWLAPDATGSNAEAY